MSNAVELKGLTKRIGSKTIVDNLTFDIPEGEVFGFLGPNGAGKTTTIRMMVGLISITAGSVSIRGYDVVRQHEQAIRQVGSIVENPEMYKYLTGYQNLKQYARMLPGVTKRRIEEMVDFVGLTDNIHQRVKTYSLGMRQRLGLAQSLLNNPSVLILDEPTNGLDPAGIRELRDHLRTLARSHGVSVIVSSHLLSEMELMCDRVAIIQHGKLISVERIGESATGDAKESTIRVFAEVDGNTQAYVALNTFPGVERVTVVNGGIEIETRREYLPSIHRRLVQADIGVYELRALNRSLEDRFLEMTGGAKRAGTSPE